MIVADGSSGDLVANPPAGVMSMRVAVMVSADSATLSALTVTDTVCVVSRGPKDNLNRAAPTSPWYHFSPACSE